MKQFTKTGCTLAVANIFFQLVASLLFTGAIHAQTPVSSTVTGTVKTGKGDPLHGVTITVKDQVKNMTRTDQQGNFTIKAPENAVLLFTHVSYTPEEIKVGKNNRVIHLTMQNQDNSLNDVVVIGYGYANRKDLTGSVGSVNVPDLQKAPVKSFDDALGGRVAGVSVISFDGQPGQSTGIRIRGAGSVTQDNSPLYVIDGFAIEGNDNNVINPADIETIDILKDASATAIYGSRGANGVIIITTKRGKTGPPVVSYNCYYGQQRDINRLEVLSPYEFVKLQLEIAPTTFGAEYTTKLGKTLDDYKNVAGIDWYGKIFRAASQQSHNLSISGGSDKTRFSITASILDQKGIIINSVFRRYQGRITLDQTVNSRLKVGVNANYTANKDNGLIVNGNGGSSSFMWTVWGYRPVQADSSIDIQDILIDPNIGNAPTRTNPFLQAQNELRENISNTLFANAYADYNIARNFRLRATGGMNSAANERDAFNNSKTRSGSTLPGSVLGVNGSETFAKTTDLSADIALTYSRKTGNNTLTALAGAGTQKRLSSSFGALASYVPNESLGLSGLDEGTPNAIYSRRSNWTFQSYFARATYNFRSKYILTATARRDGSSKFSKENRWGFFPSAALAYALGEETFIKRIKLISNTKFRIGYGVTGNNRVGDFDYYPSLGFINYGYSFGNAVPTQGAVATSLGNPDLKWEKTGMTNVGLDFSIWKGRISLTTDYYYKVTSDLLLNASLPISTGYATAFKNVGKVSNRGVEFTLNTINISTPAFQWTTDFNISFNKNKVLELSENQESITTGVSSSSTPYYIAKVGQPIAMFYGAVYDGVYQYSDFNKTTAGGYLLKDDVTANSIASLRNGIKPGDIKFRDLNNDGIINTYDMTITGNPNPDFFGGLNNNFRYKNFDLNIFFHFVYGNQIMNANVLQMELGANPNTNQYASFANRWTPDHTDTDIPRAGGATTNYNHSRSLEDGSFLRFKTASIGYTLPKSLLSRITVKSLRMYVSAQNIFVITNYSGSDPEVSVRDTALTPGYDYSAYPHTRTFVAGLALTF